MRVQAFPSGACVRITQVSFFGVDFNNPIPLTLRLASSSKGGKSIRELPK